MTFAQLRRIAGFAAVLALPVLAAHAEEINYPRATETPWYMPSELTFGAGATDPTMQKELSADVTGEIFLQPVGNAAWPDFLRFRPGGGFNADLQGKTSYGYAGIQFDLLNFRHIFFDGFFGGSINNGEANGNVDHRALGGYLEFREAATLGYQFMPNWAVSAYIDHQSNAGFVTKNQGIETAGVRLAYIFDDDAPTLSTACCGNGYQPRY
jgi:lipid A 3-O-deacylase